MSEFDFDFELYGVFANVSGPDETFEPGVLVIVGPGMSGLKYRVTGSDKTFNIVTVVRDISALQNFRTKRVPDEYVGRIFGRSDVDAESPAEKRCEEIKKKARTQLN